jgi:hypothetical protein
MARILWTTVWKEGMGLFCDGEMKKPRGVFVKETLALGYSTRSTTAQAGIGINERMPSSQMKARTQRTDFLVFQALDCRREDL